MIIGENRVVERGGMLTACETPDPSGDPDEQAHPVVNSPWLGEAPALTALTGIHYTNTGRVSAFCYFPHHWGCPWL